MAQFFRKLDDHPRL